MGKKGGSGKTYTSKGERASSISTPVEYGGQKMLNKLYAARSGRKAFVTIENPNKEQTNKKFIRVPASQFFQRAHS